MKKNSLALICCLVLSLLAGCQTTGETQVRKRHMKPGPTNMKMHVFGEGQESDTVTQPINTKDHKDSPERNMVIFSEENHEKDQVTAAPVTKAKENQQTYAVTEDQVKPVDDNAVYIREHSKSFGLDFTVLPGYRQDDLHWSIAAPSGSPNILSELQWKNLEIGYLGGEINISTPWNVVLKGKGGYGTIYAGKNQDSDYFGNDRTFEFSRSNNNSDNGYVLDGSGAIGYQFDFITTGKLDPWFSLTPLVGYSYHEQNLRVTDGFQTIPAFGPFPGLNSSYDTQWKGVWLGLDADIAITDNWDFYTGFEYHFADYSAKANWNLRDDFQHPVSFTHAADGYGIVANLSTRYKFTDYFALLATGYYQYWEAKDGNDTVFFSDGRVISTNLNEVVWQSFGFNLGLQFAF